MSSEMRELAEEGLAYFERIGDAGDKKYVAAIRALIARTEAGADGVSIWRYRFRNSETGGWHEWRYSEQEPVLNSFVADKTEIQGPFTNPQDASGDAEDAAMFRWLCDNARPWESDYEQPHALIRICRGEFQGGVGWFNIIGRESRVGVITLRDAVRCAMQAKEAK